MADRDEATRPAGLRRTPTLRTLADELGLSTATISLALRESPLVAAPTRARVQALAEATGYVANRSAASLRTARTNMVGVVVNNVINPYFAEIFRAVETALNEQSLAVMVCNHADDLRRQRTFVETLMQHRADGLIMCPAIGTDDREIERITRAGVPFVLICRDADSGRDAAELGVSTVRGDDFAGGLAVTRHLIAEGHSRIAFVGGRRLTSAGRERHAGYVEAHREAGMELDPALDFPETITQPLVREAADRLIALDPRPTAVFGFNDFVAFGIMAALRRAGLEPGRDVAVAGYDDTDVAAWSAPTLTSVHNGPERIGSLAAKLLRSQIEGEGAAPRRILVEPELRIRESTRPAPA